jgi:hypothetical protein
MKMVPYGDDADLKEQLTGLLSDMHDTADLRNCGITDFSLKDEASGLFWSDYDK